MDPDKKSFSMIRNVGGPEKLRDVLLDISKNKLAHIAGSRYASAVESCLTRDISDEMDGWHLQRYVRDKILNRLRVE